MACLKDQLQVSPSSLSLKGLVTEASTDSVVARRR